MKRVAFGIGCLILIIARTGLAHEHWITPEKNPVASGETVTILISSGHSFPNSELLLAENLLRGPWVISPSGEKSEGKVEAVGKNWRAQVKVKEAGIYQLFFILAKPQVKTPIYTGKSLLLVGACPEKVKLEALEKDALELVPAGPLCRKKPGDSIQVKLARGPAAVAGSIQVSLAGGKSWFVQTNRDGMAEIPLKSPGKYLLTAADKGQGTSFTFELKGPSSSSRLRNNHEKIALAVFVAVLVPGLRSRRGLPGDQGRSGPGNKI